jgi:hypothetical protein
MHTCADQHVANMQDTISRCWAQKAEDRPSARELVSMLRNLGPDIDRMDEQNQRGVVSEAKATGSSKQSCCVVS